MESRESKREGESEKEMKIITPDDIRIDQQEYCFIRRAIMREFNSDRIPLGIKNSLKKKFNIPNGNNY